MKHSVFAGYFLGEKKIFYINNLFFFAIKGCLS